MTPIEKLKSNIHDFTKKKDINIKKDEKELIVSANGSNYDYLFYMRISFNNSFATIQSYTIQYKYRGTGWGGNLYNIFEEYLKSLGFSEIQLHLVSHGAEKFWTKKGFSKQDHIWRKTL